MFNWFKKKQAKLYPIDFSNIKVDIHSHLIPGIDDGAKSIEDSLALIKELVKYGFKKIITTPHVMSDYYDHIFYIISVINKEPPPMIDREIEETLYKMFDMIQVPFENNCPKERINFISYGFILNRFFQLLGMTEYMRYFPLLKSRTKQRQQDQIWKGICKDLGWKYYPSG